MDCLAKLGIAVPGPIETNYSTTKASGYYAMTLNSALERHWEERHKNEPHSLTAVKTVFCFVFVRMIFRQ